MRVGRASTRQTQIRRTREEGVGTDDSSDPDLDLTSQCEFRQPGERNDHSNQIFLVAALVVCPTQTVAKEPERNFSEAHET